MRGTRYGDFSRFTFDPSKGYRGVLMQQGRVQLDADANEQQECSAHALQVALADLCGGSFAPGRQPGYRLRPWLALAFEGSDRLWLDEVPGLAPRRGEEHTLELWLSWGATPCVLASCFGGDGARGYALTIDDRGVVRLHLEIERPNHPPATRTYAATRPLPAHRPVHLALVIGLDYAALYLDALQVVRDRHDGLRDVDASVVVLGGPEGSGPAEEQGFVGLIHGARAWRSARTQAQLAAASFFGAPAQPEPGLLADWRFDEPAGPRVADAVGGHSARIEGPRPARRQLMDLVVEPGRFYVEGRLCELREHELYSHGGGTVPTGGDHLAYLEVWEETVSAVEDPALREVALGGLDTGVRTRLASRVRLAPIASPPDPDDAAAVERALAAVRAEATGRLAAQHTGDYAPGNYLYRVEIHDGGRLGEDPADPGGGEAEEIEIVEFDAGSGELLLAVRLELSIAAGTEIVVVGRDRDGTTVSRHHTVAEHRAEHGASRILLSTDASDLRHLQEPRLRRPPRPPTFKWSRDNGSSLFALLTPEHGSTVVDVLPAPRTVRPLAPGDLVEPLGSGSALDGPAHPLVRVTNVAASEGRVELASPLAHDIAYLRRWDHAPEGGASVAAPAGEAQRIGPGWIELEDGIAVRFEDGHFRRGDYWWIVSRLDLRTIEWPHAHGHPAALPPSGVERLAAPLALVSLRDEVRVEDLRRIVTALVEQRPRRDEPPEEPDDAATGDEFAHDGGEPYAGETFDSAPEYDDELVVEDDEDDEVLVIVEDEAGPYERVAGSALEVEEELVAEPGALRWQHVATLELLADELEFATAIGGAIAVATHRELFALDPGTGALRRLGELPAERRGFVLCAAGSLLLAIGGGEDPGRPDGRVFGFEMGAGSWSERAKLPRRRTALTVVAARGRVHVLGGRHAAHLRHGADDAHHVYDPETDKWDEAPELPTARSGAHAVLSGTHLHVVGGYGDGRRPKLLGTHEVYDLERRSWHAEPELPAPRPVVGAAVLHGQHVLLVGDPEGRDPHRALGLHAPSRTWSQLPPMPQRLQQPLVAGHGDQLHVLGLDAGGVLVHYRFAT